jgi:hypothetical protein
MHKEPRSQKRESENALGAAEPAESGDDSRDWATELDNILGGAAEAVFELSDEEVEEELRSMGEDPDAVAEEVRSVLLDAVDRYERSGRPVRVREGASSRSSGRGRGLPS